MKKKYLAICLSGLIGMALSGVAQGAVVFFNDTVEGDLESVDSISSYDTTYKDMTGMLVTVTFAGGIPQEAASWDSTGGVYGTGWSLTAESPDSSTYYGDWWNFSVDTGVLVESILLEGFSHNVVFDVHPSLYDYPPEFGGGEIYSDADRLALAAPGDPSKGTAGSEWGQPLITDIWGASTSYTGQIDVTFSGAVALGVYKPVGDLFQNMLIEFDSNNTFDSNETFQFFQDTDNIVAPVPEPATFALFGLGLAGLIGSRFRRKK